MANDAVTEIITEARAAQAGRLDPHGPTGTECAARDWALGAGGYVTAEQARNEGRSSAWAVANGFTPDRAEAWWADYATEIERLVAEAMRTPGTFLAHLMVTDTRVYEVVKATRCTLTLRPARDGDRTWRDPHVDQGPYPVTLTEQVPAPGAETVTVRLRQDGTYRLAEGAYPLYLCPTVDGVPVRRTDYRM